MTTVMQPQGKRGRLTRPNQGCAHDEWNMNGSLPELALDNAGNRAARKYSTREQTLRVLWACAGWLFSWSPRPLFGWRRLVLRAFGARVGAHVHVYPRARIVMPWNLDIGDWAAIGDDALIYNLGRVRIGAHATVSYRAHLCAGSHDLNDPALPLLKPPIDIAAGAWIGTDAFVGPGVSIGVGAILGARAVVMKDVAAHAVVAGNPARVIGTRRIASTLRASG
jgi:putative colanic acid biosynthesis acetyltransferase WcaF